MAKSLPKKDGVIIGLGWTGSILAQELTEAGLNVVAIERGPWRDTATDFNIGYMPDELRYAVRRELFLQPKQERPDPDGAADARLWFLPAGLRRGRRGGALERLCLALLPQRL
jgi:choline dehydrogenase-like flavoprotein